MEVTVIPNLLKLLPSILLLLLIGCLVRNYLRLRHIPGPFLAGCTDLWRLIVVFNGRADLTYVKLHEKYGDVVRIGPNCVSVMGTDALPAIYGVGSKVFLKSDFYPVTRNMVAGQRQTTIFDTQNEVYHAAIRKPAAKAYSMTTVVGLESFIDSTTSYLFSRLDEMCYQGKAFDFGRWLGYYAFDMIGELTFSKRLGFLEVADDIDGVIESISKHLRYVAVAGQMPWLDLLIRANPVSNFLSKLIFPTTADPIISFASSRMAEHLTVSNEADPHKSSHPDHLSQFLTLLDPQQAMIFTFANVFAGTDPVAITLRAIFYHLLKNPQTMEALVLELQEAESEGRFASMPFISYSESQKLPYLKAVIKEGLRIHPDAGLPLERIVPSEGLHLENTYLPPGTICGINPWIYQRDPRIFGVNASHWDPSRWIRGSEADHTTMDRNMVAFGAGPRACLGKNLALLELHKAVPAILLQYDMKLADPRKEWTILNCFFMQQNGFDIVLSKREKK